MVKTVVLKIAALFSFCGGPLFVTGLLKLHMSPGLAFLVTFLPVGFMLVGAFFLEDDPNDRVFFAGVWVGRQSLFIVLAMHLYALGCFLNGTRVPDQGLHYVGIAVGLVWTVAYLRAERRWTSSRGHPTHTPRPIEPS